MSIRFPSAPNSRTTSWPRRSTAASGRLAPFSAPIRASPGAACSPPPCWETLKRYARGSRSTPRRRWPSTMNVAGPLCYMRATRSGITSTPAGRRDLADVVRLLLDAGASPRN